jgi:hypothetical protein
MELVSRPLLFLFSAYETYITFTDMSQNVLSRVRGFGLYIGFIDHLQVISRNNYNSLTELHTPNITVTTAHIKFSQSSLVVSWQQILTQYL